MLEVLIALFLVGMAVLPLASIPLNSFTAQIKSAYAVHFHRLSDLAFAEVLEKLTSQKFSWKELSKKQTTNDDIVIDLGKAGAQKFVRRVTVVSEGKKGKDGEEWRLVTCKVTFIAPKKPSQSSRLFTYKVVLKKPITPEPAPATAPVPVPAPE